MLFLIQREGATMTQTNDPPSRLDRIEALMLEMATASMRHDNEFSRINATLGTMGTRLDQVTERIDQVTAQQAANQEAIAHLTASILDLRNVVSDYIQGRSN
jgi:5,10-methylenetetrahydrofolate reductase